jgi:hypothetical protein
MPLPRTHHRKQQVRDYAKPILLVERTGPPKGNRSRLERDVQTAIRLAVRFSGEPHPSVMLSCRKKPWTSWRFFGLEKAAKGGILCVVTDRTNSSDVRSLHRLRHPAVQINQCSLEKAILRSQHERSQTRDILGLADPHNLRPADHLPLRRFHISARFLSG